MARVDAVRAWRAEWSRERSAGGRARGRAAIFHAVRPRAPADFEKGAEVRRSTLLLAALPAVLSCGGGGPVCETREDARGGRWILECPTRVAADDVPLVGSYFDPEWTDDLPSGAHVYCSDRGPTFAWFPGVRMPDPPERWLERVVVQRIDGGAARRSRWMMSADDAGRPVYYLFGGKATAFVEGVRERGELLLETRVTYGDEPTIRLIFLDGLGDVVDQLACFRS